MTRRLLILLLAAIALSGCAGHRADLDDEKCRSYGATGGSPAYINCRGQLDAARMQARAISNASSDAIGNANAQQFIYGPVR